MTGSLVPMKARIAIVNWGSRLAFVAGGAVLVISFARGSILGTSASTFSATLAAAAGAMTAFLIAASTIVLALPATPAITALREDRRWGQLTRLLWTATLVSIVIVAVALASIAVAHGSPARVIQALMLGGSTALAVMLVQITTAVGMLAELAFKPDAPS